MLLDMEHNRIRKLLSSEYCDFADRVLIESPFAETTRDGRGLRQVALGLTPSRLIIAADILKKGSEFTCPPDLDPSIESFELVSVYPLEFVAISVFCRRKRRTLKARLIDGRAKYYELGGTRCRNVFWALWCESVRDAMAKKQDGSSLSETSAASSSSASTLYLVSSGLEIKDDPKNGGAPSGCRVWARYGGAGDGHPTSWRRKDLYLGPSYEELSHGYYTPVPVRFAGASLAELRRELADATPRGLSCKKTRASWPCARKPGGNGSTGSGALCDVLFTRERKKRCNGMRERLDRRGRGRDAVAANSPGSDRGATASEASRLSPRLAKRNISKFQQRQKSGSPAKPATPVVPKLSRFGFGIGENCSSGLYLEPWEGERERRVIRAGSQRPRPKEPRDTIDSGVRVWETGGGRTDRRRERRAARHPRRYALATAAHFFRALGPWSVQPGERESVQRARASSAVRVRRQPLEAELRLPVSRRQLAASVSMSSLEPARTGTLSSSPRTRVVLFWTPEYWYRPRAATAAYRELRRHLSLIRQFRDARERAGGMNFFRRRRRSRGDNGGESAGGLASGLASGGDRSILARIFSSGDAAGKKREGEQRAKGCSGDAATSHLRRLLRMDLRITAWDLDSATIARQLTLIDRELFQRIPPFELEILSEQRSSRSAPNLGAWIAFGHRISCLAASQVLATKKIDMRTRILSRFINAADKCLEIGNFHSCRSILAGLQSPSVYRLESTWSRLRTRHSTRYERMERLCRLFRSTATRDYRRAWRTCEARPPVLPYVGHLLARIFRDDESSPVRTGKWKNRPCRLAPSAPTEGAPTALENACRKIVSSSLADKERRDANAPASGRKKRSETERLVQHRSSMGRRLVAAACAKIGFPRADTSSATGKSEQVPWTLRERRLARKFSSKWRRRILTAKLLAENETKIREMEPKKRRIMSTSNWLRECQRHSRGYDYPAHSLAWEFLLKARYREDRENFFISLKLEPPCG